MLKKFGEGKKNDFTTEQLLDFELKNVGGESNFEVRRRMNEFFEFLLGNYGGQRVVVVSHGAAIKFFIQSYCDFDYETNSFLFEGKIVCLSKIESPSVLKLLFEDDNLIEIEKLRGVQYEI